MCEAKLQRIIIALQGQHGEKVILAGAVSQCHGFTHWQKSICSQNQVDFFQEGKKRWWMHRLVPGPTFSVSKGMSWNLGSGRCCRVHPRAPGAHHTLPLTPTCTSSTLAYDSSRTGIFSELSVKELYSRNSSV